MKRGVGYIGVDAGTILINATRPVPLTPFSAGDITAPNMSRPRILTVDNNANPSPASPAGRGRLHLQPPSPIHWF